MVAEQSGSVGRTLAEMHAGSAIYTCSCCYADSQASAVETEKEKKKLQIWRADTGQPTCFVKLMPAQKKATALGLGRFVHPVLCQSLHPLLA